MALNFINAKYFKMLNPEVSGTSNDLACKCHICGDSKTKRKKRLHLFTKDSVNDSVHCFNCGYSSSAYNYFKEFHSEYFSQYKNELNANKLSSLKDVNLSDFGQTKKSLDTITFEEFKEHFKQLDRSGAEYLLNRNFTKDDINNMKVLQGNGMVNLFGKSLNLNDFIVIPLLDENLNVFGYQARGINEKRFLTVILDGYPKVWGLHTLKENSQIYVFESIFDAVSSGFDSTLAVLGIGSTLSVVKDYKDCVIFFDNQHIDEASLKTCLELAKSGYKIVIWDKTVKAKDVNELLGFLTRDQIQRIARNETYDPMKAYLKLGAI